MYPEGGPVCSSGREARPAGQLHPVDTVMIEQARRVVVVADGSKIGRVAFAQICTLAQVDELITDRDADRAEVRKLSDVGVKVSFV